MADRRVYARLTDEGTAELGGTNLPPDRAAAAFDRVDTFARAAKADGDPRTLNQLRADTYLDLLAGVAFQTRPSRDPVTHIADQTNVEPDPTAAEQHTEAGQGPDDGRGTDSDTAPSAPTTTPCATNTATWSTRSNKAPT